MTPKQLLKHYGSKAEIAAAGEKQRKRIPTMADDGEINRQMVGGWFDRGVVPLDKQTLFEIDTNGALKAAVPKQFRKVVAAGEAAAEARP